MGSSFQHVQGFKELDNRLKALPLRLQKNVLRGGLRAGAAAMQKIVRSNTPVGAANEENVRLYGGYEGALRDSVRIATGVEADRIYAIVSVGGESKKGADVFYAHMVEWGTAKHLIKPATKEALQIADNGAGFSADGLFFANAEHPGTKPTFFMTRSFDEGVPAFVAAVKKYIDTRIDKEMRKEFKP